MYYAEKTLMKRGRINGKWLQQSVCYETGQDQREMTTTVGMLLEGLRIFLQAEVSYN